MRLESYFRLQHVFEILRLSSVTQSDCEKESSKYC